MDYVRLDSLIWKTEQFHGLKFNKKPKRRIAVVLHPLLSGCKALDIPQIIRIFMPGKSSG
jgi:hypothetical protein